MKKLILAMAAFGFVTLAHSAAHTAAPPAGKSATDKNTATVLPDSKTEHGSDKKAVRSITATESKNAKEEADKTKAGTSKPEKSTK